MSDPFEFDFTRIRIMNPIVQGGAVSVFYSYTTPLGVELIELSREFLGGWGSRISIPQMAGTPIGLPPGAIPLWKAYQEHVAGLSAHQRLEWAAAVKDGR